MGTPETLAKHLAYDDGDDHYQYYEEDDEDSCGYGFGMRVESAAYHMHDDRSDEGGDDVRGICMSRLSICNARRPIFDDQGDDYDDVHHWKPHFESGDADGELSDKREGTETKETATRTTSGSDIESGEKPSPGTSVRCNSLDALRRMRADPLSKPIEAKNYASENDARERSPRGSRRRGGYRTRVKKEKVLEKAWEMKKAMMTRRMMMAGGDDDCDDGVNLRDRDDHRSMPSTPKRTEWEYMYMDRDELKACWDLGFKVDCASMKSRLSCSTNDTNSSAGTSPIDQWRISSPGDDPTDVKARLIVWAHAVASTARLSN